MMSSRLTDAQREAFSLIERIASDPLVYLNMDFEPGDIQLLNNHYIGAFADGL